MMVNDVSGESLLLTVSNLLLKSVHGEAHAAERKERLSFLDHYNKPCFQQWFPPMFAFHDRGLFTLASVCVRVRQEEATVRLLPSREEEEGEGAQSAEVAR